MTAAIPRDWPIDPAEEAICEAICEASRAIWLDETYALTVTLYPADVALLRTINEGIARWWPR